ncbi:hypothetical protein V1291_001611 [Nitrobacteraceae bacterium AZCC 1564]
MASHEVLRTEELQPPQLLMRLFNPPVATVIVKESLTTRIHFFTMIWRNRAMHIAL